MTGGEAEVAAVIDADSLPPLEELGAGRVAVDRLRGPRDGTLNTSCTGGGARRPRDRAR